MSFKPASKQTRTEFIAQARSMDPSGRNGAIQAHLKKLEAMTDAEWPAHAAHLDEQSARFRPTVRRIAKQFAKHLPN